MPAKSVLAGTALFLFFASGGPANAATGYNAWANFKIKTNPNGPWSYLGGGALLADTIPDCVGNKKILCRWNGQQPETSCTVIANKTGGTVTYDTIVLPAKYLSLDPENVADATVQWTSPIAGTVTVSGNFLGVDTNEATHNVAVTHNGVALKTWSVSAYQQKIKFKFTVAVSVGDTIAFQSLTNNDYSYLSTGLQAVIKTQ